MFLQEARHHIRTESERYSPVIFTPASDIFVWIGPQQITEQAAVRNLEQLDDLSSEALEASNFNVHL